MEASIDIDGIKLDFINVSQTLKGGAVYIAQNNIPVLMVMDVQGSRKELYIFRLTWDTHDNVLF